MNSNVELKQMLELLLQKVDAILERLDQLEK